MTVCRNWQDLAWTDFRSLPDDTVAILPVAAVEQHGPHLPVSVDATINAGLLARALELLPDDATVLALPMQSVGLSVEHVRFPGTLTLSAETLIAVLTEIGRSVGSRGRAAAGGAEQPRRPAAGGGNRLPAAARRRHVRGKLHGEPAGPAARGRR